MVHDLPQAADIYRAAIASAIKQSKWLDAATLLMKFGGTCDKANARSSQYKAYLGKLCHQYTTDYCGALWHAGMLATCSRTALACTT